jgi:hypothetical protein
MHRLVVHLPAFPAQQDMQAPIAEAPALSRQRLQAIA